MSDNILMVFYNLKFVNELIAAVIDEDQKASFQSALIDVKYELVIEDIKSKL